IINDITEDRQGRLWVATNGVGVARLNDDLNDASSNPKKKFLNFRLNNSETANRVNAFLFDSQGNLWCATDGGLFRASVDANGPQHFELILPYEGEIAMAAFADREGRLWFGIENQLIEVEITR
ncbi:MAG TPA: two-component regulator propeller domain-containing protein, partial [Pyrinomonadaceae bacterium]|nr:two-component regulator propeller domain-containing protein [Pyrinomonadaceae bacterium]